MKVLKIQAQARFELVPPIDMNYQKWHSCSSADQCNHDLRQLFLIVELGKLILTNPMELMLIVFKVRFCFLDRKMRIVKSFELLYFHLRETCLHAIRISAGSPHPPVFVGDYLSHCIAEEARFETV